MFDPKILPEKSRMVEHQYCLWRKFKSADGAERIKFSFRNDSSLDYHHALSTYVRVCTASVMTSSREILYFCEKVDSGNGCLFFKILMDMTPRIKTGILCHDV